MSNFEKWYRAQTWTREPMVEMGGEKVPFSSLMEAFFDLYNNHITEGPTLAQINIEREFQKGP